MTQEFASREDLLAAAGERPPIEKLLLPAPVGKWIWIQGLTGKQRDKWEESLVKGRGKKRRVDTSNVRAKLAVLCIVDGHETRQRVYTDEDAPRIGNLPATILAPIYEVCQRLSGVSDEDADELEQGSAEEDGSASPSNSPSNSAG
jgi:hypothetical protein